MSPGKPIVDWRTITSLEQPGTYLNACPDMKFDCDGEVSSWEFYSASDFPTSVYFGVWRRDSPNDINYKLVGYNAYNTTSPGRVVSFGTKLAPQLEPVPEPM